MTATKDKERGTWFVQCSYVDYTGERKRTTKRGFQTKREAIEWERDFQSRKEGALTMTLSSFYKQYEEDVRPSLKLNTWLNKQQIIENKIIPYLGQLKMNEIRPTDVLHWQNELKSFRDRTGAAYSQTYLRTVANQLSALFNHAVKYYNLPENPMHKAGKMGSKRAPEMKFWTKDEYLAFSEAMMSKPVSYLAFEVLYWTGIREGELLALTPSDFDLNRNLLTINKSYQRIHGQDVITPPKTEKSNRVITMPRFLTEEVDEHIRFTKTPPHTRLFRIAKSYLYHEMDRGSKETGVKRIRIHDLRHSHVSLLIELGYSIPAIAQRAGHEGEDITLRYAHLFPNKQAEMANALDQIKGGAQ